MLISASFPRTRALAHQAFNSPSRGVGISSFILLNKRFLALAANSTPLGEIQLRRPFYASGSRRWSFDLRDICSAVISHNKRVKRHDSSNSGRLRHGAAREAIESGRPFERAVSPWPFTISRGIPRRSGRRLARFLPSSKHSPGYGAGL